MAVVQKSVSSAVLELFSGAHFTNIGTEYAEGYDNWRYSFSFCRDLRDVGKNELPRYYIPGGMKIGENVYVADNEAEIEKAIYEDARYFYEITTEPFIYTADDGCVYKYYDHGDELYVNDLDTKKLESVTTVSEINGKPIGKISMGVDENNRFLKSIKISEGIKEFDLRTCGRYRELSDVWLPDSLEVYDSLGGLPKLKNVRLPSNMHSLSDQMFRGCPELETIDLPDSIETIGYNAFGACPKLKHIDLPENLSTIEESAFSMSGLEGELVIPAKVNSIGLSAFTTTNISKVTFLGHVSYIGNAAFKACKNLTEVVGLTDEQITKFWKAFSKTPFAGEYESENDMEDFLISNGVLTAYRGTGREVVIPDTVKEIADDAFLGYTKTIRALTIPNSVTKIGANAFYGAQMQELIIPSSVKRICHNAFSDCTNLERLIIEDGNTVVEDYAFQFCTALTDVSIGKGVSVSPLAFNESAYAYPNATPDPNATPAPKATPDPKATTAPQATPDPKATPAPRVLTVSETNGKITVSVDGAPVVFTDAEPFIDDHDRTQIPVRAVTEALGAAVDWNEEAEIVTVSAGDADITLKIGSDVMSVNGEERKMDTAAVTIGDRTYIPLRFAAEALGMTVNYAD